MIKELLQPLYIEYLTEAVPMGYYANGDKKANTKPRVRHPEMWKMLAEKYPGKTLDIDEKTWVWSDQHFGHKNIIGFSDRPYDDITHMREDMIRNYNCFVEQDDTCVFVGDFAFLPDDEANAVLGRMRGRKILIIGNHDIHKKKLKKLRFDEIYFCAHAEVNGIDFVFTHYPMRNVPDWCYNIHGHEHVANLYTKTANHFNVNCELHEYCPIMMRTITDQAKIRVLQED